MRHVAGGIDVDQEADAGDNEDHDDGELIHLKIEACTEGAGNDPIEKFLVNEFLTLFEKFADGFECGDKGQAGRRKRDGVDDFVRPVFAEKSVDSRAEERQGRNDPEDVEYRRRH